MIARVFVKKGADQECNRWMKIQIIVEIPAGLYYYPSVLVAIKGG